MAFSIQRAVSDGTLSLLDISISYIDRTEIAVFFDSVVQAEGTTWDWVGITDAKISFTPAVPIDVEVAVVRSTDLSDLRHRFAGGAAFTAESLDESLEQILHIAQEAAEQLQGSDFYNEIDLHGYRIKNVGDGVDMGDAVNVGQLSTHNGTILGYVEDAEEAAAAAAASYDSFDDRYLGSKSSAPTTDNDGNPLLIGALYWDTSTSSLWVWGGINWIEVLATDAALVSYTPAGTGAVTTTVREQLREFVHVVNFMTSADRTANYLAPGSVDLTYAIQAAADAVGAREVRFPSGICVFSDHDNDGIGLIQRSGQKWVGEGSGASILRLSAATTDIDIAVMTEDGSEDYAFESLQIDGNRGNITPATDLYNTFFLLVGPVGGKRGTYRDLLLANSWGRALQTSNESAVSYCEDVLVDGVRVVNSGTKAISATKSKRVTIRNCFSEVYPYTSADHPGGVGDGNAGSGSCFECNDSQDVIVSGNHGMQIGTVEAPGIRLINGSKRIRVFGNTIDGASYLGFIQNVDDIDFFGNQGADIKVTGVLIADADGEAAGNGCERIRIHHNTITDPDDAFVQIIANKSGAANAVECYIYDNDFVQISGTPQYGIYNSGVIAPAPSGQCLVYQWGNRFTGTIPEQLTGPASAEIQPQPERGWQILAQSSVAVAHTGNTNETVLASIFVPKNRIGKNGRVRITAHFSYTNSGNNKITRVRFGGAQAGAYTNTTTAQQRVQIEVGNRNALDSQIVSVPGASSGAGATTTAVLPLAINTANDISIALSGQLASAGESITLESYVVELFYGL